MKVIRSSAARKNAIIGRAFFAICITGTSVSELATNRLTPIGGVTNPMARLTTMITPNWIGFIPIACTIGSRIGVRIRIAGVVSMTIPTISRKRLMISRIATGLWKLFRINSLTVCGTCIRVSTLEKAVEAARMNRIGVKVRIASTRIGQISRSLMLLYTNRLMIRA